MQQERQDRAAAIAEAVDFERSRTNVDKKLAEMTRELQISKEEARRAWEELGRREQEERERMASLREGQPTMIGGVQVVPMTQGVPSRGGSTSRSSRETSRQEPVQEPEGPIEDPDVTYQQYSRAQRAEPADPFVEQQTVSTTRAQRSRQTPSTSATGTYAQEYTQAPAVQPAAAPAAFYQQHQDVSLHPVDPTGRAEHNPSYGPSVASEGAFSEEEYEIDAERSVCSRCEWKQSPLS